MYPMSKIPYHGRRNIRSYTSSSIRTGNFLLLSTAADAVVVTAAFGNGQTFVLNRQLNLEELCAEMFRPECSSNAYNYFDSRNIGATVGMLILFPKQMIGVSKSLRFPNLAHRTLLIVLLSFAGLFNSTDHCLTNY